MLRKYFQLQPHRHSHKFPSNLLKGLWHELGTKHFESTLALLQNPLTHSLKSHLDLASECNGFPCVSCFCFPFPSDLCTECIYLLQLSCLVGVYKGIAGVYTYLSIYAHTPAIYRGIYSGTYLHKLNLPDTGDAGFLI